MIGRAKRGEVKELPLNCGFQGCMTLVAIWNLGNCCCFCFHHCYFMFMILVYRPWNWSPVPTNTHSYANLFARHHSCREMAPTSLLILCHCISFTGAVFQQNSNYKWGWEVCFYPSNPCYTRREQN